MYYLAGKAGSLAENYSPPDWHVHKLPGPMKAQRIFLLSPAHCGGKRAAMLFREQASFDLALRLREPAGATIGDAFSFLSGLYFRGKLAYARAFAAPPGAMCGAYAITSNRGLLPVETRITLPELRAFGDVDIAAANERYRLPLERDARRLLAEMNGDGQVVLLGSVASGKYVDVLLEVFGDRLHFPAEFVGRGDMSRGGLMLRCVEDARELDYAPVAGAILRGKRPPKLERRSTAGASFTTEITEDTEGNTEERNSRSANGREADQMKRLI
jgi:hypothetical protein